MKTEFPRNYLAAAAQFMAAQDVRYYLKGVFVECLPTETRLVATDGSVLGALRQVRKNESVFQVIIPAETIAVILKLAGETVMLECFSGQWRIQGIPFKPVDGEFPAYRRAIPTAWSREAGDYLPDLLARFVKAAKALKHKGAPIVRQSGANAALVHFYAFDDFVGVLMPLRLFTEKAPDLGAPTWGPNYA